MEILFVYFFWNKKCIFSHTFDLCGRVGDKKKSPDRFLETRQLFLASVLGKTVCSCHVKYAFQGESTIYSCLNVKELLAQNRREVWSLVDCNGTRTHNHFVRQRTLNHLTKLHGSVFVYELSGCGFDSRCSIGNVLTKLWTTMFQIRTKYCGTQRKYFHSNVGKFFYLENITTWKIKSSTSNVSLCVSNELVQITVTEAKKWCNWKNWKKRQPV